MHGIGLHCAVLCCAVSHQVGCREDSALLAVKLDPELIVLVLLLLMLLLLLMMLE